MTPYLWRAFAGRVILVALSGLALAGAAIADELAQPEHIEVPARLPLHRGG